MSTEPESSLPDLILEAIDVLTKFSVPLYIHDSAGRPEQYGTGFFVRVGETHFLLSAAHVLDVAQHRKVFFYATTRTLRYLTGKVLATSNPATRSQDPLDIAVMRLTGSSQPPHPDADKFAIDISWLKQNHTPRSGKHYAIIGFPATKSRVDINTRSALVRAYSYRSDSIDDAEYSALGLRPSDHVVLPLNLKRGFDAEGKTVTFPKPQGMSGSPIVVLYDAAETGATSSSVFDVVAVGIEYRKTSKVLIGTDVRFALEMIGQHLSR